MLSEAFLKELDEASPSTRVTGIIRWKSSQYAAGGTDGMLASIADAKRPLLKAARDCPDVKVNPLDGIPHSILDAPVESWRLLLRSQRELLEDEGLVVDANLSVFSIPPTP